MFQEGVKFFQGADNAFLGGIFGATQRFADGTQVALLEEAQHNGHAVLVA